MILDSHGWPASYILSGVPKTSIESGLMQTRALVSRSSYSRSLDDFFKGADQVVRPRILYLS
jgi:hypothetical protein